MLFWNFLFRVGYERNETIIIIFSLSRPFQPYFDLKGSHIGLFKIFELFAILLEFSITRCVGTERTGPIIFILSLSRHFPTYFDLK